MGDFTNSKESGNNDEKETQNIKTEDKIEEVLSDFGGDIGYATVSMEKTVVSDPKIPIIQTEEDNFIENGDNNINVDFESRDEDSDYSASKRVIEENFLCPYCD